MLELPANPRPLPSTKVSTRPHTFPSKGLSQNQLCKRFGISPNNVSARAKRREMTSHQLLELETGWRFNASDRKYYPPE